MIKVFAQRTCAFDVEWVPCADTARRLLGLSQGTDDRTAFEAIRQHYAKDGETRSFLKFALCKVVSIAAVFRTHLGDEPVRLELYTRSVADRSEAALIHDFLETVAGSGYQLWGYNSASADLPILKQRAIALGVTCPKFSKRPPKPWEGFDYHDARNSVAHMDILQLLSGYNRGAATPSLNEFAAACGLPGKLDGSGADVADMYLAGQFERIVGYNATDALTTHLLMLQLARHTGHLTVDAFEYERTAVQNLVAEQVTLGKRHFIRYQQALGAHRLSSPPVTLPSVAAPLDADTLREQWQALLMLQPHLIKRVLRR